MPDLMQRAPAPGGGIGTELLARLGPGGGERGIEQRIARRRRIGAEPRVGVGEQAEQHRGRDLVDQLARPLGHDRREHARAELAPEHLEERRRAAVGVEPRVPAAQHRDRRLAPRPRLGRAAARRSCARRRRQRVVHGARRCRRGCAAAAPTARRRSARSDRDRGRRKPGCGRAASLRAGCSGWPRRTSPWPGYIRSAAREKSRMPVQS